MALKTEQITLRMGSKLMERAKSRAEDQEKSLAEWIRTAIENELKRDLREKKEDGI